MILSNSARPSRAAPHAPSAPFRAGGGGGSPAPPRRARSLREHAQEARVVERRQALVEARQREYDVLGRVGRGEMTCVALLELRVERHVGLEHGPRLPVPIREQHQPVLERHDVDGRVADALARWGGSTPGARTRARAGLPRGSTSGSPGSRRRCHVARDASSDENGIEPGARRERGADPADDERRHAQAAARTPRALPVRPCAARGTPSRRRSRRRSACGRCRGRSPA